MTEPLNRIKWEKFGGIYLYFPSSDCGYSLKAKIIANMQLVFELEFRGEDTWHFATIEEVNAKVIDHELSRGMGVPE